MITEQHSKAMIHHGIVMVLIFLCGCIPIKEFGKAWDEAKIDPELEGHWKQTGEEFPIKNSYQSFIRNGDAYDIETQNASMANMAEEMKKGIPPTRGRTLTIGKHKFLLMNERARNDETAKSFKEMEAEIAKRHPELTSGTKAQGTAQTPDPLLAQDGSVQRYALVNGVLTFYILKDNTIEEAVKKGTVKGFAFMIPGPDGSTNTTGLATLDEATQQYLGRLADEPNHWREVKFTQVKDLAGDLKQSRTYPATPKTVENTAVRVDLPGFQFFCEGRGELFRRHLQASPEWCVFQDGREVVVYRRQNKNGEWRLGSGSNGYVSNWEERVIDKTSKDPMIQAFGRPIEKNERYQIRYLFRFDQGDGIAAPSPMHRQIWERYTQVATPTAGDVTLKLKSDDQGIESILVTGKPGLWFEFFEQTHKEPRGQTREALVWLDGFSRELQAAAQEIEENGYAAKLIPEGAVRQGKSAMALTVPDPDWSWRIRVNAAVNPGRQGFVFLKAFNSGADGAQLKFSSWLSKEYIGWSKHPETLFSFKTDLDLSQEATKKGAKVRIELWFRPTDGTASEKWFAQTDPADVKLLEAIKEF